jgi:hypothetical protein
MTDCAICSNKITEDMCSCHRNMDEYKTKECDKFKDISMTPTGINCKMKDDGLTKEERIRRRLNRISHGENLLSEADKNAFSKGGHWCFNPKSPDFGKKLI